MKIIVKNLTESIITLTGLNAILRGMSSPMGEIAFFDLNESQIGELNALERSKIIEVIREGVDVKVPETSDIKKKSSKKIKPIRRISNNKTSDQDETEGQERQEDAIIVTAGGTTKTASFNSPVEIEESEQTRASIEAMEKLEESKKQARSRLRKKSNKNKKEDPSEKMGEKATVVVGGNKTKQVAMKNSIVSEVSEDSDTIQLISPSEYGMEDGENDAFIES